MFTSFSSERPANARVWDFSQNVANSNLRVVSLTDDCEQYQIIRTGGSFSPGTTNIRVYLPEACIEGKVITIVNAQYTANNVYVTIYASDLIGTAINSTGSDYPMYTLGPGASIDLIYSTYLNSRSSGSYGTSRWGSLRMGAFGLVNPSAVAVGGDSNSATAQFSVVAGGSTNKSAGSYSAVVGGLANTANDTYSSTLGGTQNSALGAASVVVGGSYGDARSTNGRAVFPANWSAAGSAGKAQNTKLVLYAQTTDATATVLKSDPFGAGGSNQLTLPTQSFAYYVNGNVIANNGTIAKGWKIECVIKRASGSSVALVGAATVTSSYADAGTAAWTVAVTADTTNQCLAVTVTGAAGVTIAWMCELNSTEGGL